MKPINGNLIALCVVGAVFSMAAHAGVDQVTIDSGKVQGRIEGAVVSFKGIPFAGPPVGVNRWRAPQPVHPWTDVRPATEYGPDCMQNPFPGDAAPLGVAPREDCLYANVWAPAARGGQKLAVMVWIYGGGFVNGGSSPAVYSGAHFAERGVVLISFNYRLGRFGFFAHPALTNENPAGPLGNYAYLDQIAALQWVQRNAASFGGDPGNVTIFGESAGGMSVLMLLTSPMAHGLFQKAIVESGGGRSNLLLPPKSLQQGEAAGVAFAKANGITGEDEAALKALRDLPADTVVNKLNMATMGAAAATYAGPMIDGKIVVETADQAFRAGHEAKVPLIAGANSADIGFSFAKSFDEVYAPFGDDRKKAEAAWNAQGDATVSTVRSAVAMDSMMVEPARFIVSMMAAAGAPAYEYRFTYVAESMRKAWKGAPHATEIPFVFDTVAARYTDKITAQDEKTGAAANKYWVAFAKTGDPDSAGGPRWPRYNASQDMLLNFTESGSVAEADPWKARLDLVSGVASRAHATAK
jgi:para-nitrobenzyl esterase